MSKNKPAKPSRAARRRAARLAAVQALYDMEIGRHTAIQAIENFRLRGGTADLDGETIIADEEFFIALMRGVVDEHKELDRLVALAISSGRMVKSLETVLRAILRAGAWEMLRREEIDPPVIISEYLTVTAAFYDPAETSFVNGILDKLASVLRGDGAFDEPEVAPDADEATPDEATSATTTSAETENS